MTITHPHLAQLLIILFDFLIGIVAFRLDGYRDLLWNIVNKAIDSDNLQDKLVLNPTAKGIEKNN